MFISLLQKIYSDVKIFKNIFLEYSRLTATQRSFIIIADPFIGGVVAGFGPIESIVKTLVVAIVQGHNDIAKVLHHLKQKILDMQ